MTHRNPPTRSGATLVELLVVIAIITALGGLALMMLPSIANSDMSLKGTSEVQTTCRIAQSMASSARHPRGVRFLANPNNPSISTEMVLLEAPVVMVPEHDVLVAKPNDPRGQNVLSSQRVVFQYERYNGTEASIDPQHRGMNPPYIPPAGTIKNRHCYIVGLNADQESQIADGAILVLPVLNAWSRIIGPPVQFPAAPPAPVQAPPRTVEVFLEVYPDALLGTATDYVSYHFGIYGPPVPILGEATFPLPRDICVDLEVSYPPGQPGRNYDIMFAPSGQTITTYTTAANTGVPANVGVYLWVRDYQKVGSMHPNAYGGYNTAYADAYRMGGEQQIVGIRNGFVGTARVFWPNPTGAFTPGTDPYTEARLKLN